MSWSKLFFIVVAFKGTQIFGTELEQLESKIFSLTPELINLKYRLDEARKLIEPPKQKKHYKAPSEWEKLNYEHLRRAWKKELIRLHYYDFWKDAKGHPET